MIKTRMMIPNMTDVTERTLKLGINLDLIMLK